MQNKLKAAGIKPCNNFKLRRLDELTIRLAGIVPVPANCGNCIYYDEKGGCSHGKAIHEPGR